MVEYETQTEPTNVSSKEDNDENRTSVLKPDRIVGHYRDFSRVEDVNEEKKVVPLHRASDKRKLYQANSRSSQS